MAEVYAESLTELLKMQARSGSIQNPLKRNIWTVNGERLYTKNRIHGGVGTFRAICKTLAGDVLAQQIALGITK